MRVLYIASNGKTESSLRIEQDITELTKAAVQSAGDAPNFMFLPALPFEEIEQQIAAFKPDIVHISAHGKRKQLRLSDSEEESVAITAPAFAGFIICAPSKGALLERLHRNSRSKRTRV